MNNNTGNQNITQIRLKTMIKIPTKREKMIAQIDEKIFRSTFQKIKARSEK